MANNMNFGVNLIPTNNSLTLGNSNSSNQWNGQYIQNINANNITSGTVSATLLPLATTSNVGGIKVFSEVDSTSQTYKVALTSGQAYVGIPWTDTKVTMTNNTNNSAYPILFKPGTSATSTVSFGSSFTFNPSKGELKISGGTAQNVICSTFTGLATKAAAANLTTTNGGLAYYQDAAGKFGHIAPAATGKVLISNGTNSAPSWSTITSAHISDGAIVNDKIANSTISTAKINKPYIIFGNQTVNLGDTLTTSSFISDLSLKVTQSTVDSSSFGLASSQTITTFISNIQQNANGELTGELSIIPTCSNSQLGLMRIGQGLHDASSGVVEVGFGDTATDAQRFSFTPLLKSLAVSPVIQYDHV